jgi:hypothetical protein
MEANLRYTTDGATQLGGLVSFMTEKFRTLIGFRILLELH